MLWNGEANWEFSACRLIVTVYLPIWPEYLSFLMPGTRFACFRPEINPGSRCQTAFHPSVSQTVS
jgi:hypothetical protein